MRIQPQMRVGTFDGVYLNMLEIAQQIVCEVCVFVQRIAVQPLKKYTKP